MTGNPEIKEMLTMTWKIKGWVWKKKKSNFYGINSVEHSSQSTEDSVEHSVELFMKWFTVYLQ